MSSASTNVAALSLYVETAISLRQYADILRQRCLLCMAKSDVL